MPLSETAQRIVRYLGGRPGEERGCYEEPIRRDLDLTAENYQAAIDELTDYGLVGPALTGDTDGCVALTEEGRMVLNTGFDPDRLPLTPAALARNTIVATSWAVDRVVSGQELPPERGALAAEIARAVRGLLPLAEECMTPGAMEAIRGAAEALIAEVHQPEPRAIVIRRALRVMGFPEGALNFNTPIVSALPGLAEAIDVLLS